MIPAEQKTWDNRTFFETVEEILADGGKIQLRIKGHSMYPTLRDGRDTVVLEKARPGSLRKGNIVLFRYYGGHILHRIVSIRGNTLTLQGDGAIRNRETARIDNIVGLAIAVIRTDGQTTPLDTFRSRSWAWAWTRLRPLRRYLLGILRRFYPL